MSDKCIYCGGMLPDGRGSADCPTCDGGTLVMRFEPRKFDSELTRLRAIEAAAKLAEKALARTASHFKGTDAPLGIALDVALSALRNALKEA